MAKKKSTRQESSYTSVGSIKTGDIAVYSNSAYFRKKDEKAIEFLKKHPFPAKVIK